MKNDTRKILISLLVLITMLFSMTAMTVSAADDGTDSGTITVYFRNDWMWPEVYCHYWDSTSSSTWPGVKMTLCGTQDDGNGSIKDVYSVQIPSGTTGLLFNGPHAEYADQTQQTPNIESGIADGKAWTIHWDGENKVKEISYTPGSSSNPGGSTGDNNNTDSDKTVTVYAGNSAGWDTVYCYYWVYGQNNPNWPGVPMKDEGNDIWSCEIPDNYNRVIFNNGSGQQTEDLVIPTDGKTNVCDVAGCMKGSGNTNAWSTKENYKPSAPPVAPENTTREVTLVLDNQAGWEYVCVYYWPCDAEGSGWPGDMLEPAADGLYYAVIPEGNYYVIFNNGNGGEGNQSPDMVIPTDDYVVYNNATDSWSEKYLEANHPSTGDSSNNGSGSGNKMTFLQKAAKVLLICLRTVELFFKNIGAWFTNLFAGFKK